MPLSCYAIIDGWIPFTSSQKPRVTPKIKIGSQYAGPTTDDVLDLFHLPATDHMTIVKNAEPEAAMITAFLDTPMPRHALP
jgi:hypothetical protein